MFYTVRLKTYYKRIIPLFQFSSDLELRFLFIPSPLPAQPKTIDTLGQLYGYFQETRQTTKVYEFFFPFLALARVYVNTQLASEGKGSGLLPQDWSETVGTGSHKGQRFLVGALDEVYIYTSALTQNQIRELACICEDSTGNRDLSHLSSTPGSRGVFSNSPFSHLP